VYNVFKNIDGGRISLMIIWGKLIGGLFGYLIFGPLGAIFGAFIGHSFDRGLALNMRGLNREEQAKVQQVFFKTTFEVMGHIAKADGRVSEDEIQMARTVMERMRLTAAQKKQAIQYFNQGKQADFNLDVALHNLLAVCQRQQILLQMFVEIQFQAASADGLTGPNKRRILEALCSRLGFSPFFSRFEHVFGGGAHNGGGSYRGGQGSYQPQSSLSNDYEILEIDKTATNGDIKKSYRRLMSQNHPDKLIAKGLPEEMIRIATDKTQQIQAAYERVKEARGI
jgi:DnaJ like chaperone protein